MRAAALRFASDDGPQLRKGDTVGRLTVLDHLGEGGFGIVLAAYDPELDRKVALKVLRTSVFGSAHAAQARARLLREARAMARLNHPNVVTVHDVGTVEGHVYIAMEFVDGGTIHDWQKNESPGWREIVDAFLAAGHGLAAAHAAGLVHRDVKPDNILVGNDDRVRVTDFGIVSASGRDAGAGDAPADEARPSLSGDTPLDATLTRTGAIVGTPTYMAPEQHAGGKIDARSDQFGFAAALYHALYGRPPFAGDTYTDLALNLAEGNVRPPPPDTNVPGWVHAILLQALSGEPDDRYPTMDALLADLEYDPVPARRRRRRRAGVGLLFATLVAVAALWYWNHTRLKVSYYRKVVYRRGVPVGVGRLTENEVSHRVRSYRVESRRGRVRAVVRINRWGYQGAWDSIAEMRRASRWEVRYRSDGSVDELVHLDHNGRIVRVDEYSNDQTVVTFRTALHAAHARPLNPEQPTDRRSEITQYQQRYDDRGYIAAEIFQNHWGMPRADASGAYGVLYDRDERGLILRERVVDQAGRVMVRKNGVATVEREYDAHGEVVEERYLDAEGHLMPGEEGCARSEALLDRWGNQQEWTCVGVDGEPIRSREGFAKGTIRHDDRGSEISFFGVDGEPILNRDSVAKVTHRFDEHGNIVATAHFGLDGKPALSKAGIAGYTSRFDKRGNKVEQTHVGIDGRPTAAAGPATLTWRYDERGHQVEQASFGVDGAPALNGHGYAKSTSRYDKRGNHVEQAFFGIHGEPVLNKFGCAKSTSRYDERGNKVETRFFGTDGEPVLHEFGFARITWRYDERGNTVEVAFFGIDGKPAPGKSGYARVIWRYDQHGNRVESRLFGSDGAPVLHELGFASVASRYDERGNQIERAYFGLDGNPALRRDGYARITWDYDAAGNKIDTNCYDADGERLQREPGPLPEACVPPTDRSDTP